jgi:hypothetical protein
LIAILALFLAIAETGAKSAQTEALSRNIEAANLWAFFQARTIRQTTVRTAGETVELTRAATEDPAQQAALQGQIERWRDQAARWESEPDTGEGRRELSARAQAAQTRRDRAFDAYEKYELASAAFQVAIVLASASIITGVPLLTLIAGLVGVAGLGMGVLAYFPHIHVPHLPLY